MKKVTTQLPFLILAFLCLSSFNLLAADPVFTLNGGDVCENAMVEVDITAADFTDIVSIQFTLGWDPTVMQIQDVVNIDPAISDILFGNYTVESNTLTVSWLESSASSVSVPDETVLFTLQFNVVGDNSSLSMVTFIDTPTMREVSGIENGQLVLVDGTWNNGMVMVAQPELGSVVVNNDVNMTSVGSIDVTITNGTAPYTFVWETGQTTEDLMDVPMGDYICTVTDAKGCESNIGPFTVDNTVSTDEIEGLIDVQIFPNPTSGNLNLAAQLETAQELQIIIYNILGEKVYFEQIESANIERNLDLSDLAIGNYIVQLSTADGMYVEKLQIHR